MKPISFSPDETHLASLSNRNELYVWNTETYDLIKHIWMPNTALSIRFLPDHTHILLVSDQGTLDKINYIDGVKVESFLRYWVPYARINVNGVWMSENTIVLGGLSRYYNIQQINLSKFVHGTCWTECRGSVV